MPMSRGWFVVRERVEWSTIVKVDGGRVDPLPRARGLPPDFEQSEIVAPYEPGGVLSHSFGGSYVRLRIPNPGYTHGDLIVAIRRDGTVDVAAGSVIVSVRPDKPGVVIDNGPDLGGEGGEA